MSRREILFENEDFRVSRNPGQRTVDVERSVPDLLGGLYWHYVGKLSGFHSSLVLAIVNRILDVRESSIPIAPDKAAD